MKKLLLLSVLPLLLVSCSNKNAPRKVSKSEFMTHWKSPSACRKPVRADGSYKYRYDAENMSIVGGTDAHDRASDKVIYTFNPDGSFNMDHTPNFANYQKPYQLKAEEIANAENQYDQYGQCLVYEFFINPLRASFTRILLSYEDGNIAKSVQKITLTYNSDMLVINAKYSYSLTGYIGNSVCYQVEAVESNLTYTF